MNLKFLLIILSILLLIDAQENIMVQSSHQDNNFFSLSTKNVTNFNLPTYTITLNFSQWNTSGNNYYVEVQIYNISRQDARQRMILASSRSQSNLSLTNLNNSVKSQSSSTLFDLTGYFIQRKNMFLRVNLLDVLSSNQKTLFFTFSDLSSTPNPSTSFSIETRLAKSNFLICPLGCSDLGSCNQGQCFCGEGFIDQDCSTQATYLNDYRVNELYLRSGQWQYFYMRADPEKGPIYLSISTDDYSSIWISLVYRGYTKSLVPNLETNSQAIEFQTLNTLTYTIPQNSIDQIANEEQNYLIIGFYNGNLIATSKKFSLWYTYDDGSQDPKKTSFVHIIFIVLVSIAVLSIIFICYRTKCCKCSKQRELNNQENQQIPNQGIPGVQNQNNQPNNQDQVNLNIENLGLSEYQIRLQQQQYIILQQFHQLRQSSQQNKKKKDSSKQYNELYKQVIESQTVSSINQSYPSLLQNQPECIVCLLSFQDQENVKITPCFHLFHQECLDSWVLKFRNCPFCRENMEYQKILKIKQQKDLGQGPDLNPYASRIVRENAQPEQNQQHKPSPHQSILKLEDENQDQIGNNEQQLQVQEGDFIEIQQVQNQNQQNNNVIDLDFSISDD